MAPTITDLHLVKYPVTIADQRQLDFDPDLSFPFTTEDCRYPTNCGYPHEDDAIPNGYTTLKFEASNETELVDRLTEYLVTCYDCSDIKICHAETPILTPSIVAIHPDLILLV